MNLHNRKSHTTLDKIYFWTATIHNWQHLLHDQNKKIIINYLKKLSDEKFIVVYGFVIMPNHIHLILKQLKKNGKENAFGSFLKYTAHTFLSELKHLGLADHYKVNASNKQHEIWKRDSLAIEIYTRKIARQKLDYIHTNPVKGVWQLAKDDTHYYYSSAMFYEKGFNDFGFLKNIFSEFDGE